MPSYAVLLDVISGGGHDVTGRETCPSTLKVFQIDSKVGYRECR